MNLFDLTQEALSLEDFYESASEEEKQNILMIKNDNKEEIIEKIIEYSKLMKQIEYENSIIKMELKRLEQKMKLKVKFIDSLKQNVVIAMNAIDESKLQDETINVVKAKVPLRLEVNKEEQVPLDYKKVNLIFDAGAVNIFDIIDLETRFGDRMKKDYKISKTAINDWHKQTGEVIDGTYMPEQKYSIRIK